MKGRKVDTITMEGPVQRCSARMHVAVEDCTRPGGLFHCVLVVCVAFGVSACASSNELTSSRPDRSATDTGLLVKEAPVPEAETDWLIVESLRNEVSKWAGTPYRMGGTTVNGIDCSAFVQRVYANVFGMGLPRTTSEQANSGAGINRRELQPGDLVFFRLPTRTRHVGVYLSDGEFAHASSSQGVMTSRLDEPYWERAYWTSRRFLASPELPTSIAVRAQEPLPDLTERLPGRTKAAPEQETVVEPAAVSRSGRIGW